MKVRVLVTENEAIGVKMANQADKVPNGYTKWVSYLMFREYAKIRGWKYETSHKKVENLQRIDPDAIESED